MEHYTSFTWQHAPLNHVAVPVAVGAAYAVVVTLWAAKLRSKAVSEPQKKKPKSPTLVSILRLHNIVLSLGSLVMFVGALVEIVRRWHTAGHGLWLVCEDAEATSPNGPLFFWSYMYYLSKFYELLDTFLALLNGSIPPSFNLHVFHHATVPLMAWLWLETVQSLQFVGLLANTAVHVLMYYYYALRTSGTTPSWKNMVTRAQIVQFMTSFVCLLLCLAVHFYGPDMQRLLAPPAVVPSTGCAGMPALAFNAVFNLTLLASFLGVLNRNTKLRKTK